MTDLLDQSVAHPEDVSIDITAWAIGTPRLLAGLHADETLDLHAHLATHGPLVGTDLERLLTYLEGIGGLAGRGGAGFPLAAKIRVLAPGRRRIVVNGTESEPASRKDRVLLRRTPHLVLDGALAVATAVGARDITIAVHDEVTAARIRTAIAERRDVLGSDMTGSGAKRVQVATTSGGFVAGEVRAVVRALAGGPALPPGRRTPSTSSGTLASNAETFAQVAVLLRIGPHRFADTGTSAEPGTTLLTVGGAVERPGVLEIPIGTPLGIVLAAVRAPEHIQAVVVGGYHGSWHAPNPQIRLSRGGLASAGGTFGAGVLLVLDERTCALGELARVTGWLAGESAKQCGPCRFGLPALAADVAALAAGRPAVSAAGRPAVSAAGRPAVSAALEHARVVTGRGACAHPDGTARFVISGVHLLRDETDLHLAHGGCSRPVFGQLPIGDRR